MKSLEKLTVEFAMKKCVFVFVVVAALGGCKDEPATSTEPDSQLFPPGKGDSPSPCAADDGLVTCLTTECPGVTGPDFDTCFEANCADSADDTPDECAECVVGGFTGGFDAAGIASACAGTGGDEDAKCTTDEPVLACINTNCAGVVDQEFDTCFEDNCEADATDTPIQCALCISDGFQASLDAEGITTACTGSTGSSATLSGVACSADDLDLFTCLSSSCPDADTSDAVGECIADSCSDAAEATKVPCLVCVDSHLASGGAGSAEDACTAADSSPCTVAVATAMQDCADRACAGRQGDALDECMDNECPEVFDDVSEGCGNCVIGLNQRGVPFSDAAGVCAGG